MTELVRYTAANTVATLTMDSPHNRNALSRKLVGELFAGLDRAEADDGVRVVLIQAEGRVFCSGADLSEASEGGMVQGASGIVELQRRIVASPKPVVCRVQGAVRAGGIGIVAASDLAVAATSATFALTEVRLALAPAVISLTVLPRLTSRAASWAFLTGETFDGALAAEIGLVTRAVESDALDAEVEDVLEHLCAGHPQGLRESKRLVNAALLAGIERDGEEMAALSQRLFASEEARSAMLAFLSRKREG